MGKSRQERRRIEREIKKQRSFEQKYSKAIEDRQDRVDDRTVEIYTTCMGLAVYDLYGYMPKRVNRIVTQFCNRLMSLADPNVDFPALQKELKDKTGIQFVWKKEETLNA